MAGDWIKWTKGLPDKPEVVRMAGLLGLPRAEVVVRLLKFWEWCDDNIAEDSVNADGHAFVKLSPNDGDNMAFLDTLVGTPSFAGSLADVDWIRFRDGRIELPNFGRHNGETAKSRARNAQNQARRRERAKTQSPANKATPTVSARASPKVSPSGGDKPVTRGEESREEETSIEVSQAEDCTEAARRPSPVPTLGVADPVVLEFPTSGNRSTWELRQSQLERFQQLYPGVDVLQCCQNALGWCEANVRKRKTFNGMPAFLHNWISKDQNELTRRNRSREERGHGGSVATASAARFRSGNLLGQLDRELSEGGPARRPDSQVG
jgi:hypothetical protein